jgi:hypothetical protein
MDSCSACHRLSGRGQNFTFPTLAGNSSVLSAEKRRAEGPDWAVWIAVIMIVRSALRRAD